MKRKRKQFDIVLVDYGKETIGSEQGGCRPSVIVQNDIGNYYSTTTLVMPLTKEIKNLSQSTHALLLRGADNHLHFDSMVLGECIRQVSEERIKRYIGCISNEKDRENIKKVYYANANF